nr:SpoIID/LytB domain-containing protein [uncultured Anaerotignum sp.]
MKGKRTLVSILACALLLTAAPVEAMAYTVPETVRVGLESVCKNVSSASIGVWELHIGTQRDSDFREGGVITSNGLFTAKPSVADYIAVDGERSCAEALELAKDLKRDGLDAYAAYLSGRDWTVYVKDASVSEVEAAADENARRVSFEGVAITGGEAPVLVPEEAVMMGGNTADTFKLNSMPYRGMLTFSVKGSTMTGVNVIGLEEYLYGVVPSEMPRSYHAEALKAQAVAARTYAMTKLGAHSGSGYQLCDTTACQVYKGYSNEADATTAAVNETAGEVACYQGSPIEAVFSASTGGYTENSENVWNTVVPYLRAVKEVGEFDESSWTKTLTLADLTALLQAKGAGIGKAEDIRITKISEGGRVQELQIIGTSGVKTLNKESIRTYFSSACGTLPSKMFTINGKGGASAAGGGVSQGSGLLSAAASQGIIAKTEGALSYLNGKRLSVDVDAKQTQASANSNAVYTVSISTVQNGKFVFSGRGSGHGVGLSQKGAQAMAQKGYDYEEILCHYYTGITIEG